MEISGVPRGFGGFGGSASPPKFRRPSKIVPNSSRLWKLKNLLNLWSQHPKMFGKEGSKIPKLPPVRNCFTLTMTNKLVVILVTTTSKHQASVDIPGRELLIYEAINLWWSWPMFGSYTPAKIKYEVLARVVCSALAGYICNVEIM